MSDLRPGSGAGQTGHSRVTEEIEHLWTLQLLDALVEPIPVGRLLREEGEVSKGREPTGKPHISPGQREGFNRPSGKAPATGFVFVVRIENSVRSLESRRIARPPPALGFWSDNRVGAVSFKLASVATVQQGIVWPGTGQQGFRLWRENGRHGAGHRPLVCLASSHRRSGQPGLREVSGLVPGERLGDQPPRCMSEGEA